MFSHESGIYQIRNILDNKIYIGSTIDFHRRYREHWSELRGNRHHNKYLQNAWNKYGEENFIFEILSVVDGEESLSSLEQKFLDKIHPDYNISDCIDAPFLGKHLSEKSKKKLSKMRQGKKNPFYGQTHTEESKRKMSEWQKDKKLSLEHKQALLDANLGEKSHYAKLTWDDVRKIRELFSTGNYNNRELGNMFNVTPSNVCYIVRNKTWIE